MVPTLWFLKLATTILKDPHFDVGIPDLKGIQNEKGPGKLAVSE